jgi:hypothetical protein
MSSEPIVSTARPAYESDRSAGGAAVAVADTMAASADYSCGE